jgi:hypothetical protein
LDGNRARRWEIQSGVKPPQSKKEGSGISRGDAEVRKGGGRVPQLPKAFCGNEGVLECSGLTELGMGIERVDGKIQSGVKPPQSKKQGSGISREDAEVRKGGGRVPQLPKTFCGHEGCPGVLRLDGAWDGNRARRWENPKRCQATAVQETRIRSEFFDSNFRFPHSPPLSPQALDSRLPSLDPVALSP